MHKQENDRAILHEAGLDGFGRKKLREGKHPSSQSERTDLENGAS
jgi:hypothetical protein